ncbi:MAG: FHA domain-containing protein [Syntrophobacteria bacterium]|jgi:hypothetical protein
MTGSDERRRYVRIDRQFVTQIFTPRSDYKTQGVTENVSQGGAYIKVEDWRAFQTGDQTVITFFLPPSFTDRGKTIGLRGEAEVKRVDQQNEGIALEFSRDFQEFEKIDHVEIAETSRYNKISYYLQTASVLEFAGFIRANPHGFLLEKSQNVLDDKVVFQFNTVSLDDDHAMQPITRDFSVASVLESKVIEVKRRKSDKAKNTITIGRASANDIVLYNSTISKTHAYLYIHPSRAACYLVDCGSQNGTLLNGEVLKPFERYKVVDCDEICFGPQTKIVYFSSIALANFINQLRATSSA